MRIRSHHKRNMNHMEPHHRESIEKFLSLYTSDTSILAILLGGSIAHGFAESESDIDVLLIVDEPEYLRRQKDNKLAFSLWDICTYEGGYIDCKVVSLNLLHKVSVTGSDPARYAYQDNLILFSRIETLDELLAEISRFPLQDKETRRTRFAAAIFGRRRTDYRLAKSFFKGQRIDLDGA